ncbi:hypothetical protein ANN_05726, partial [Periplaneta americana]
VSQCTVERNIIPEYLRQSVVAFFRSLTGRNCLSKHLKRTGIISSSYCLLCSFQEEMDQNDLRQCPAPSSKPGMQNCATIVADITSQNMLTQPFLSTLASMDMSPHSPDLTSCDNALWRFIKNIVAQEQYDTTDQLKDDMRRAFQQITLTMLRNAVILSDSKAAILSIVSKHTPSSQTAEITKILSQLISLNKRIVFQWIPSHCGIPGIENTDALAKKGSTATYRPVTKSTYYSVKRFIKSTYLDFNKQNLITQSQGKKWNSLHQNPQLIPDLPRKSSVAAFRLTTGHDCLAKHLHRIGIYQSPNCPLCNSNQEMDSEHLKICASLAGHDNIFEKYWSARGQMTLLSNAWH